MSMFKSPRATTVTIGAEAMDPMALQAVSAFVVDHEAKYAKNPSDALDIGVPATTTAVKVPIEGKLPYTIYVFDVYADVSAGTYNFDFLEEVPNYDSISS